MKEIVNVFIICFWINLEFVDAFRITKCNNNKRQQRHQSCILHGCQQRHYQLQHTGNINHIICRHRTSSLFATQRSRSQHDEDVYEDEMEEILELGGDPFFMVSEKEATTNEQDNDDKIEDFNTYMEKLEAREERIAEIEAAGGDPFFLDDDNDGDGDDMQRQFQQNKMVYDQQQRKRTEKREVSDNVPSPLSASSIFSSIGGSSFGDGAEDDTYEDSSALDLRSAEVEAMGGDPFFLNNDDDDDESDEFDEEFEDPSIDQGSDDAAALSAFANMALSASGGGVMDLLGKKNMSMGGKQQQEPIQRNDMPSFSSSMDMKWAELESMGGDPFFLDDDDSDATEAFDDNEDEIITNPSSILSQMAFASGSDAVSSILGRKSERMENKQEGSTLPNKNFRNDNDEEEENDGDNWEWDGIVDEEAHMDIL